MNRPTADAFDYMQEIFNLAQQMKDNMSKLKDCRSLILEAKQEICALVDRDEEVFNEDPAYLEWLDAKQEEKEAMEFWGKPL